MTLRELFEAEGGWLRGLSASHGQVTLTIERASREVDASDPERPRVTFVVALRVESAAFKPSSSLWTPRYSPEFSPALVEELETSPDEREAVVEELGKVARRLGVGEEPREREVCEQMLLAAVSPPREGSLMRWMADHLDPAPQRSWELSHPTTGTRVEVELVAIGCPGLGFAPEAGHSVAQLAVSWPVRDAGAADAPACSTDLWLELGGVTRWSAQHGPASSEDEGALKQLVERFLAWIPVCLQRFLDERRPPLEPGMFRELCACFPLATLLEARLRDGPPGPPPVPPLPEPGGAPPAIRCPPRTKLRRELRKLASEALVVLEVGGFLLALLDDRGTWMPPGGSSGLALCAPEGRRWVQVFSSSPLYADRWLVDGDAFAFRRFVEWMRAGLVASGLDASVTFWPEQDNEGTEQDAPPIDASHQAATRVLEAAGWELSARPSDDQERRPVRRTLSEWLRFGVPHAGEVFLVDWRHQWDIVDSGLSEPEAMSDQWFPRQDRALWRRFLQEVVDPRFASYTPAVGRGEQR